MLWGTDDDDGSSSSGGSSKEDKKKKGLVKSILEGITNIFLKVFVPGDDYFQNYFQDLNNFFSDRFGFLYYPFELIIKILNNFMNIDDYDIDSEENQPQDITSSAINTRYLVQSMDMYYFKYANNYGFLNFDLSENYTVDIKFHFGVDFQPSAVISGNTYFKNGSGGDSLGRFTKIGRDLNITYTAKEDCEVVLNCTNYDTTLSNRVYFYITVVVTPPQPDNVPGSFAFPDIPEPFTRRSFDKRWKYQSL